MDTDSMFDYRKFPHLSREGILADTNNKFRTVSLFLETCPKGSEHEVMWCLSETEQYCEVTQRWIPSAWMVYIYADNEYDAMRKIVGNVRQWETLTKLKWFKEKYSMWVQEQQMMQKSVIKSALMLTVLSGANGTVSAAKMLMDQFGTNVAKGAGRPSPKEKPEANDDVQDDFERIVPLTSRK